MAAVAVFAAGCGGTTTNTGGAPGEVSGVVFDTAGNVVRDASVSVPNNGPSTVSNSSGTYILHDVPAEDLIVQADVTKNGVHYVGQNLARVFSTDRDKSVNIVVVPDTDLAQIHGTVRDAGGNVVSGARVFAVGSNNMSSNSDVTDNNGNYTISTLEAGINYELSAGAPDFQSDGTVVTLNAGDDLREDFTITSTTGVNTLAPPTGLAAVAWTSPDDSTRSIGAASAYEQIKRLYDPKRAARAVATRLTPSGDIVEVDLTWNPLSSDFLLGYGIYRASGSSGPLQADDFLRDPLAQFYADTDSSLQEQATYSYAATSVNTDRAESVLSPRVSVTTLGPVLLRTPGFAPLTFRWGPVGGAQSYVVYLFDQEPTIGVDSIWNNSANPTTGTSLAYSGPSLISGHTYFYVVLALANGNDSRSISPVDSFVD